MTTPAGRPRDAVGWAYGVLVILILASPLIEYGPIVWRRFQTLDFAHYQLTDAEFAEAGSLRYLRDSLILTGSLGGLLIKGIDRRGLLRFLGWEFLLVAIGTVGHISLPRPDLYVAGLRWVLNIHFAAILVLVLSGCSDRFWRRFVWYFGGGLAVLMGVLIAGLLYQWTVLGFVVGFRLTSFLPQAEMVTELAQGVAFWTIAVAPSVTLELLAIAQLIAVGFLTATRMAPVFAALLLARWPIYWVASVARPARLNLPALAPIGLIVFGCAATASVPLASLVAQRGPVLEQQFQSARLSGWDDEFQIMAAQSPATLWFGKGLGYRTTTAGTLHLDDRYGDPYIQGHENAVAALFAQVGGIGLIVIMAGGAALLGRLLAIAGDDPRALCRIAALAAVIAVLSMAGYWYEWPLFVQPVAVGLAWMMRPPRRQAAPLQHEDSLLGDPVGDAALRAEAGAES